MMIKKIIKRIIFPNTNSSKDYINYLKKRGCKIGKDTYFFDPRSTLIDDSRPEFIEIGERCKITKGVIILAHDYSYSVVREIYHEVLPTSAVTKIGNNVFIGMNAIILMGSTIGDNVIIGAGAVVKGDIPSGTIYAGNPAKQISTIEEYHNKLKNNLLSNAELHANRLLEIKGRKPFINEMGYYSWIFMNKNKENKEGYFDKLPFYGDSHDEAVKDYMRLDNLYEDFKEFLNNVNK